MEVFEALDKVEHILGDKREYLLGDSFTEADIRLWVTIVSNHTFYHTANPYLRGNLPLVRYASTQSMLVTSSAISEPSGMVTLRFTGPFHRGPLPFCCLHAFM